MRSVIVATVLGAVCVAFFVPVTFGEDTNPGGSIIDDPLGGRMLLDIVSSFMTALRDVAVAVAVVLIIYGGFQIMTAGGSPEKLNTGKKTLIYTAIGLGVILLAQTIVAVVQEILQG